MREDMPLTKGAKKVFADAIKYANRGPVTSLHLLWAMLADEKSIVSTSLIENGVTRELIEKEISRRNAR